MKEKITLILNHQESMLIRHSLDFYAENWKERYREVRNVMECDLVSADIRKLCEKELRNIDTNRISTQRLWEKVSHEMYGSSSDPEHILTAFQDPDQND